MQSHSTRIVRLHDPHHSCLLGAFRIALASRVVGDHDAGSHNSATSPEIPATACKQTVLSERSEGLSAVGEAYLVMFVIESMRGHRL